MTSLQDEHPDIQVARSLAAQGVPIFVAAPDDSQKAGFALPKGWESTQADPAALDAWKPGYAVCAVMGAVCDALDVDPRHSGDRTAAGLQRAGLWPRSYGRASTPSGGTHDLIARTHSKKGSKDGVDLQAGDDQGEGRGFIFIAPTERPSKVTGEIVPYRWTVEPDVGDTEGDDSAEAIAPVFAKAEKAREAYVMTGDVAGEAEVRQRALQLADRLRKAPDGEGNNTAASVAACMGNYVAAGQISKADAIGILLNSISTWEFSHRKDREAMQDTIIRQVEFGMKTVRPWEAAKSVDFTEEVVVAEPEMTAVEKMLSELLTRDGMMNIEIPPPLIYGLLDQGKSARLNGPSNVGKSFFALDMAACIGTGRSWQGYKVAQGNVIYIVAEGATGMKKRLLAWEEHYGDKMDNVYFLPRPVQATGHEWDTLIEVCKTLNPKFIILDTQARITVGMDENNAKDAGLVIDKIERLRMATGACVMLVHHTGHEGTRGRGSTAFTGAFDHEMVLTKDESEVITLKETKQKDYAKDGDMKFRLKVVGERDEFAEIDLRSCVVVKDGKVETSEEDKYTQADARVIYVLEINGGEASQAEMIRAWSDQSGGPRVKAYSPNKAKEAFRRAERRGVIRETEKSSPARPRYSLRTLDERMA